jgi:molybdenum cofactor biosynthesis enzyme MoaA
MTLPGAASPASYPEVPLFAFDTLWLQVAGTLCNLECTHCFIASSPRNHSHEMMTLAQVQRHLAEAAALGVREYYFTGGEPFLNREILEMIEAALALGPVTVLTNALLLKPGTAQRLRELFDASPYSLDLRVSIDGYDAPTNDPIRGAGSLERILAGIRNLTEAGLNPVLTVTEACEGAGTEEGRQRWLAFLRAIGLTQPRLKVMPLLRLGAETHRSRNYEAWETLQGRTLTRAEAEPLVCASSRTATAKGVYVCPILIEFPEARMGSALHEGRRPATLANQACYTCHARGLSCRT